CGRSPLRRRPSPGSAPRRCAAAETRWERALRWATGRAVRDLTWLMAYGWWLWSMADGRQAERWSGATAISSQRSAISVNRLGLLVHVVHQHVLPERVRRREVCLALADVGDAADEAHEIVVAGQHERVDHDAALAAGGDLRARLGDDERVEAEGV